MIYRYIFSFRKKTLLIHFFLFFICLAIFFPFVEWMVEKVTIHSITHRTGELIRKIQKAPSLESMVEYLRTEKTFVFFRITLFDHDGHSIYDSHFYAANDAEQRQLLNEERPEVIQAVKYGEGFGTRYSNLFRQSMVYAALSFVAHGQEYVLSIGMPFSEIRALSHDFEVGFLSFGVFSFLLYGLAIWFFIHRLSRPIQQIVTAIQPYQEGKVEFIPRIEMGKEIQARNEFGRLAQTFNALNERIQKQIAHLVEQQQRTNDILESLGEGVIAMDMDLSIRFANQSSCHMLGVACDALINRKLSEIQARRQGLVMQCQEIVRLSFERMETITLTYTEQEAQKYYFDLVAAPQSKHGGMILVLQDKTSDYEVIEMGKDFIANASHELRTPITVIRGFAETLYEVPHLTEIQTKEINEKIYKTSLRLDGLVKSLLILADIENLQEEQFHWADLVSVAENCKELVLAAHPHVKITMHKKSSQVSIWADVDLLSMAVMNLLENAVKYSPVPASIDMTIELHREFAQLHVKDRGIGIPDVDLPRIFDRFYTVNKARSRKFGGTGLGLSIVKSIIQKHRGDVGVISKLGEGSVFSIRLPVKYTPPSP
jgi:two-component system, OmpR family, phosphate regulon sensor histidine kinase PhoR